MSASQPTILAMGGGGFTMEPDNPALDDFALSLTGAREPRVLFLPTASGDPAAQIQGFHQRFGGRAVHADVLSLFRRQDATRTLSEIVAEQDLIYVGGGSLRNLLAIWRAHGLDECLHRAWQAGTVLVGLSAGAMCWFEGGVTTSSGPPSPIAGLGWLPGSLTVHADGEPERLPVWLEAVRVGRAARRLGRRRRGRPALARHGARTHRLLAPGDDGAARRRGRWGARAPPRDAGAAAGRRPAAGVRRRAGAAGRAAPAPLKDELRH